MTNKILEDFVTAESVSLEMIEKYKTKLPKQIIQIWQEYGFGSFMNGFMKVVNPEKFQDLAERVYCMGYKSVPIFVTGLGDMIVWEEGTYLTVLRFRHGIFSIMEKGCNFFLNDLTDDDYVEEFFKPQNYYIALKDQGTIAYDECFGYVPLLCLGGSESPDNLEKVKALEYMELIYSISGSVG